MTLTIDTTDARTAYDVLACLSLETCESIVSDHLSEAVHLIALRWVRAVSDWDIQEFIDALAAHDPSLAGLCAHVLADLHSVERLCPPAKARRQRVAP